METYKKVYIKSEADLPKENGYTFCHHKKADRNECINYMGVEWDGEYFMDHIDWYLQPIEITDEDIEAKANEFANKYGLNARMAAYLGYKRGAKAALNGEIKHIEKPSNEDPHS